MQGLIHLEQAPDKVIILMINPFIPEFLKWTLPSLNLDMSTASNRGFSVKIENRLANHVDPDEMALYELSHLDLHCLHRHPFWSARLKGLKCYVVVLRSCLCLGRKICVFVCVFVLDMRSLSITSVTHKL